MHQRQLSQLDKFIAGIGTALSGTRQPAGRPARDNPAGQISADESSNVLTDKERAHAAGLMRVNHAGEIAAQGLYQGHAAVARDASIEAQMQHAAEEEYDHLAWCEQRLDELDSGPSQLSPLWYAGSFAIGALSGVLGDKWSLGFIAETERQVCDHLEGHLDELPEKDQRSRMIVRQMRDEEKEHGEAAIEAGAAELPGGIKQLMKLTARIMTTTAYRI